MFRLNACDFVSKCKRRHLILQVHAINNVVRPFHRCNTCATYSNLKIESNRANLNVLRGTVRTFFTMSDNAFKLKRQSCWRSAILAHLSKDSKFKPLESLEGRNNCAVAGRSEALPQERSDDKMKRQEYYQRMVMNSLGKKPMDLRKVLDEEPSQILKTFFADVSNKLYNATYRLDEPAYTALKNDTWSCTYWFMWPKVFPNIGIGATKKLACYNSAKAALQWLTDNHHMDENGKPILPESKPMCISPAFDTDLYHKSWDNRVVIDKAPKETLRNFLMQVANRFKSPLYRPTNPDFDLNRDNTWLCTYNIHWPYTMCFTEKGFSKKDASHCSAKTALTWLKSSNYMDDFGKPIFNVFSKPSVRPYSTSSKVDLNDNDISEKTPVTPPIENLKTLYPFPKSTLHNCFQIVSTELQQKELRLMPQYTRQKRNGAWTCTYNLLWPEATKISETAPTKQEASNKAALAALSWLQQNKKINKEGLPLIYDRKEVTKITKKTYPAVTFDRFIEKSLNQIVDLYKKNLVTALVSGLSDREAHVDDAVQGLEERWPEMVDSRRFRPKFAGVQFYVAKEPVKLPISDYRDDIIAQLRNNRVLIVKGEPGCGKSTRVPQYVLEAWARDGNPDEEPCRIIVTQPRRIAAISLAERVASERQESVGATVGYHVRLKSNFNHRTGHIMYCTTGILLRRLQSDPTLSDCSHIILDEAHERDVNTDLLMNLVRHALNLNPKLKLLVMSATLEAKVFQDYFNDAAVLHIPGFTYPVNEQFLEEDESSKTYQMCMGQYPAVVVDDVVQVIKDIHSERPEGAILCFLPGWDDITKVRKALAESRGGDDMVVLSLHSKLQVSEQQRIFSRPPPGVRKVILATNIAETSITIDDVVYVIDTGIHKEERFDVEKGVSCIDNHWISQASATQRKGRAGRCQAGECYHLYPTGKHDQMLEYSLPEILRTSLTKIVLDSKVYSNNMNAVEFLEQLVCPPDRSAVEKAVEELKELELLDENENLTSLGRTVSEFQLPPKLSKAMVNSVIFRCVTPVIDIATLFSSDSALFAKGLVDTEGIREVKRKFSKGSDHLSYMRMLEMWLSFVEENNFDAATRFCEDTGLVQYKLNTMQKLRDIHFDYLRKGLKNASPLPDEFSDNDELVKAVLLSGVGSVLQHRTWDIVKGRLKKTNVLLTRSNHKATITSESVNSRRGRFPSDFLLHINETISNLRHTTLVRETSLISPIAVLLFRKGQLTIEEVAKENYSDKIKSDDQVLIKVGGTKMIFLCDRAQANAVRECKEAIAACSQYYTHQLTQGGDSNENVNFYWNQILRILDKILNTQKLDN